MIVLQHLIINFSSIARYAKSGRNETMNLKAKQYIMISTPAPKSSKDTKNHPLENIAPQSNPLIQ
jgi:ABC-type dipeptide/oligopeptide/nickel transport system permease subunit